MCDDQYHLVKKQLVSIQRFLEPLKPVANAHMSGFFTNDCWALLPEDIKNEALTVSIKDMYDMFWNWGKNPRNFHVEGAIGKFFEDCWNMSLASYADIHIMHLQGKAAVDNLAVKQAKFLPLKKVHEINHLLDTVANLCAQSKSNVVVDIGGGKGYLGSSLVLQKGLNVLSIDSRPSNTKGALILFQKLEKDGYNTSNEGIPYKRITEFVTSATDVSALVKESFRPSSLQCKVCLTGLHVCGDLASTCIKLFCKNQDITSLCTIGCCYNLLSEAFPEEHNEESVTSTVDPGFPLSKCLKSQQYVLGRNARMIACQSLDRICNEKRENDTFHFLACCPTSPLEKIYGQDCELSVGRHCSKSTNLSDYLKKAELSLKKDLKLSDEVVQKLDLETRCSHDMMAKLYCIRLALAPVIEALLLLDKLLYLHEQGFNNACIAKVFDGIKSPRCFAVIALKN